MKLFDSELQYLSELYKKLEEALVPAEEAGPHGNHAALANRILKNRELISRVEQMNARVFQLAQEWEKFRHHIDGTSRQKTQLLADKVRRQAIDLAKTAEKRGIELSSSRMTFEREMAEVQKGHQYLESVKPVKNNYPKFIDSHG